MTPTRREWILIVVCGLAWFTVYNVALNAAEQRIDAGTTAMLVNIGPILIAVFAGLFLGEGFPGWLVLGLVVAFIGAMLIGLSTAQTDDADILGVVLCVVAAVTYAIGVVCQKPVLRRLPAIQVTWIACTIGMVGCLPALGQPGRRGDATRPAARSPASSTSAWCRRRSPSAPGRFALSRMSAGRLGVTTYLVPPITIVMAWLLLDEVPTASGHRRRRDLPGRRHAVAAARAVAPRRPAGERADDHGRSCSTSGECSSASTTCRGCYLGVARAGIALSDEIESRLSSCSSSTT